MAKPILIANWKNHPGSLGEARMILRRLARDYRTYKQVALFIAPPLPYLESVSLRCRKFAGLASQDMASLPQGTHTGIVTPDILKSLGVRLAIIGHSESRALGETDESVSQKVKIALHSGITALVCVGEQARDEEGKHFEFLRGQLKLSLGGLGRRSDLSKLAVAYEPVWAVGALSQGVIEPADLTESVIFIRKVLTELFGRTKAGGIPILYGGSVAPLNVGTLLHQTGIKGFLVGRASLDAKSFKIIAESLITK